jgi:phage shock protein A
MRAILRRIRLIIRVWLHALLAPAEDPRQVFALAQKRQVELLGKVREALATVTASREQLKRNTAEAREKLPQLEERARRALLGGREDQARFALQLRQVVVEETRELEGQVGQLEEEQQALTLVEHRLTAQIDAFFARQDVLAARYSSVEAHLRIKEALTGVSEELAGLDVALERVEETTENMQARVSAIDELVETGILELPTGRTSGSMPLKLPGGPEDTAVEDLLSDLKRDLKLS